MFVGIFIDSVLLIFGITAAGWLVGRLIDRLKG